MSGMKQDALAKVSPEVGVQVADVQNLRALAGDLLGSGLFQGVKNVAGAVTVIQAGLELGIPPVAALNTMVIINGRLAMEAKALLAVAQRRAGVTWRVVKEDDKGCEIMFSRPNWPDTSSTFTEEEARAAGLLGKTNWKLWAKDMYFARAAGRGIRRIAPDAVLGLYAKEEMADAPANLNAPSTAQLAPETKAEYEALKAKPLPRVRDEFDPEAPAPKENPDLDLVAEAEETNPGPCDPDGPSLASLEAFAKVKAELQELGIGEETIWTGIHRYTADTFKKAVIEVSEFSTAELDAVNGYLHRKKKATESDRAKKAKGNV